jgi:hypothetical protein
VYGLPAIGHRYWDDLERFPSGLGSVDVRHYRRLQLHKQHGLPVEAGVLLLFRFS